MLKELYDDNQQLKRKCRPTEHKCRQKKEQLPCINLIELSNEGKLKIHRYRRALVS